MSKDIQKDRLISLLQKENRLLQEQNCFLAGVIYAQKEHIDPEAYARIEEVLQKYIDCKTGSNDEALRDLVELELKEGPYGL